ncbi:MAG: sigma-70 family RNA polymerase sigma factor [Ruminococcus sp.]|nr:sigma-70 family RNA polymerase sigma factor [Ruminococcus sp.]
MRRYSEVSITKKNENLLTYNVFESEEDNTADIIRMKELAKKAILNELTDKQRYCLCQYYITGRSMKSIAAELGVNPSTVTRHIKKATQRIKRIAAYY